MKLSRFLQSVYNSLKKVPTPEDITSREIVRKAIEFKNPPRIPYCMFFYPTRGDIFDLGFIAKWLLPRKPKPKNGFYSDEWGVKWQVTGRWHDTAVEYPLADLTNLMNYHFPNIVPKGMFILFRTLARLATRKGKYIVVPNLVNMYERMRSLMGFEELIIAPYKQPDLLEELLDQLTDMTIDLIKQFGKNRLFDAFMTWEDWGLQTRLQMKTKTFQEFYKPRYKRIVDATHDSGLHFIWHSCGYIMDLIPEMIDLGVDVLQIDQPRLMGHQNLIDILGQKLCMWNCVDIQWSNQPCIINDEVKYELEQMIRVYDIDKFNGGFIFRNYPDPEDIAISKERQEFINHTFLQLISKERNVNY
ncbi:MAG: uroporphyrinogen decarboxylase family protein [Candidatus Hodarchaeota archaeon]